MIDLSAENPQEITYRALEGPAGLDRFATLCRESGLKPGDRLAMSVGNRFEFVEIMYGAMRAGRGAGAVEHQARQRRPRLHHPRCRMRWRDLSSLRPIRNLAALADAIGCRMKIAARGRAQGLERLRNPPEGHAAGIFCRSHRRRPPIVPALYVRFDRQAQRRRADACGAAMVDPRGAAILAGRTGRPRAHGSAPLPQERHGRRDQANAALRGIGR